MKVILVLASLLMLATIIEAFPSLPETESAKKPGEIVKFGTRKVRIRKFRTTTTSTTTVPPTTSTTTTTTSTTPPPNEPEESSGTREALMGSRSQRESRRFNEMVGSASSNNVIDLGEQDLENLDLTKLYDRDTSKDDPDAPTVLQFTAPSSTSFNDPDYIKQIIERQLGEGYQYTNYTITPSVISSDYTAPFPKDGFSLPPADNFGKFDLTELSNGGEDPTVRPTKHEFPSAPPVQIQTTYSTHSPKTSPTPAITSDYVVPTKEFVSAIRLQGYTSIPSRGQSGISTPIPSPSPNPKFKILTPIQEYETPKTYNSPSPPPTVYTSQSPPQQIYSSPTPASTYISLPPIYSSPTPPSTYNSIPVVYSSPTPQTIYTTGPTKIYSSPTPQMIYSSGPPKIYSAVGPQDTYTTHSTYIIPKPTVVYKAPENQINPGAILGFSSASSTGTHYTRVTSSVPTSVPPTKSTFTSSYATLPKGSSLGSANEFMTPPAKESSSSAWTEYSPPKETLPPVKVTFPSDDQKETKSPVYTPPSIRPGGYSTLSEKMVAPDLTPAVTGGYGEDDSPNKYSTNVIRGFSNGQEDYNQYPPFSGPPQDSVSFASDDESGPTIIRHHHHYVNYAPGEELPKIPAGYERAPKNILETLNNKDKEESEGVIYGKPGSTQLRLPAASSFVRFPSESYRDTGIPYYEDSASPSYGPPSPSAPSDSYGPPSPSAPSDSYGPPSGPSESYGPPSAPSYDSYGSPPSSNYGPPQPGPSYGPPQPGPSYGPPEENPGERPKIFKTIYVNLPPAEQPTPKPQPIKHRVPLAPQRHYKIVFIKAPTPPPPVEHEVELPPAPESKTLIYVLHKKPDPAPPIKIIAPKPTEPSKPEVHFIKYKENKGGNIEIEKPSGDYGLPSGGSGKDSQDFAPGTPLGLSDMGYHDISSSESKVEVQVTKSVTSKKEKA